MLDPAADLFHMKLLGVWSQVAVRLQKVLQGLHDPWTRVKDDVQAGPC